MASKKRKGRSSDDGDDDFEGGASTTEASEEDALSGELSSEEEEKRSRKSKSSSSKKKKSKHSKKKHKKEKRRKSETKRREGKSGRSTPAPRSTRAKRTRYAESSSDQSDDASSDASDSSESEPEALTKATAQRRKGPNLVKTSSPAGRVSDGADDDKHVSFRPAHRSRKRKAQAGSGAGDDAAPGLPESDTEVLPFTSKQKEEEETDSEVEEEDDDSDKNPDQEWESACSACKKESDTKHLLVCETCPRVYHLYCLDPPLNRVPKGDWHCPHCALLIEFEKMERILDVRTVSVHVPENETLVKTIAHSKEQLHARSRKQQGKSAGSGKAAGGKAQPVTAPGGGGDTRKEFLLKFKGMSYMHSRWVTEKRLMRAVRMVQVIKQKWSRYVKQRQEGDLAGQQGNEDDDDITRDYVHNINPQWLLVDRVIAKKHGPLCPAPGLTPMGAGSATPPHTRDCTQYLVKWKELGYEMCTWEDERVLDGYKAELAAFEARKPIGEVALEARLARAQAKREQREQGDSGNKADGVGSGSRKFLTTPTWLHGGELHPYQLEGLNWLFHKWQSRENVILADEMGLGKTVQSIALLCALEAEEYLGRPHLVVVPLSTLRNWERELATWAPQLNVVSLVGNAEARKVILDHELYAPLPPGTTRDKATVTTRVKFHVLLTSYELLLSEASALQRAADWGVLVVDEGHRLKSKSSRLFTELQAFKSHFRLLLTGTPLQNNMGELFMLLHFLEPRKFSNQQDFEEQFSDLSGEAQVRMLHEQLAPHLLRRMKKDVLKKLPPKQEQVVRVELSDLQKKFYKSLLERHYPVLAAGAGRAATTATAMKNLMMELRKCCNHPYLFDGADPELADPAAAMTHLIESSGKLALLDRLLPKLLQKGHRILLYSQFTRVLDIIEDWLEARHRAFQRIDGTIPGAERQRRIDMFNRSPDAYPIFLLSTRAGGVGINLATADTVIIYDSDWNPHNDLQAQARAHRLGQTRPVMIYRLVTRATIEERMMQVSRKKLLLEHLVVRKMGQGTSGKQQALKQSELDDMLRYGAKELFQEDEEQGVKEQTTTSAGGGAAGSSGPAAAEEAGATAAGSAGGAGPSSKKIVYDDAALEVLLDRSELLTKGEQEEEGGDDDDLFKAFKVANFNMVVDEATPEAAAAAAPEAVLDPEAIIQQVCPEQADPGGAAFWDNLIGHKYVDDKMMELAARGRGMRERGKVKYTEDFPEISSSSDSDSDKDSDEFQASEDDDSEEEEVEVEGSDEDAMELRKMEKRMKQSAAAQKRRQGGGKDQPLPGRRKRQGSAGPTPASGAALPPLMSGSGDALKVLGFNQRERGLFIITFMRYGLPTGGEVNGLTAALSHNPEDLGSHKEKLEGVYAPFMQRLPGKPLAHVMAYCQLLVRSCCQPSPEDAPNFPSGVPKVSMLGNHKPSEVVSRMGHMHMIRIKLAASEMAKQFSLNPGQLANSIKCTTHWPRKYDYLLLRGTLIHGFGNYKRMIQDKTLDLQAPLLAELGMSAPGGAAPPTAPAADGAAKSDQQQSTLKPYDEQVFHTKASEWLSERMLAVLNVLDYELQQANESKVNTPPPAAAAAAPATAPAAAPPSVAKDAAPSSHAGNGTTAGQSGAQAAAAAAINIAAKTAMDQLPKLPVLTPEQLNSMPPHQRIQYLQLLQQQRVRDVLSAANTASDPAAAAAAAAAPRPSPTPPGAAGGSTQPGQQQQPIRVVPAAPPPPPPPLPEPSGVMAEIPLDSLPSSDTSTLWASKRLLAQMYNQIVTQLIAVRDETAAASSSLDTQNPAAMQKAARRFRQQVNIAAKDITELLSRLPAMGTIDNMLKQAQAQIAARQAQERALAEERKRAAALHEQRRQAQAVALQRQKLMKDVTAASDKVVRLKALIDARKKELRQLEKMTLDAEAQQVQATRTLAAFEKQVSNSGAAPQAATAVQDVVVNKDSKTQQAPGHSAPADAAPAPALPVPTLGTSGGSGQQGGVSNPPAGPGSRLSPMLDILAAVTAAAAATNDLLAQEPAVAGAGASPPPAAPSQEAAQGPSVAAAEAAAGETCDKASSGEQQAVSAGQKKTSGAAVAEEEQLGPVVSLGSSDGGEGGSSDLARKGSAGDAAATTAGAAATTTSEAPGGDQAAAAPFSAPEAVALDDGGVPAAADAARVAVKLEAGHTVYRSSGHSPQDRATAQVQPREVLVIDDDDE